MCAVPAHAPMVYSAATATPSSPSGARAMAGQPVRLPRRALTLPGVARRCEAPPVAAPAADKDELPTPAAVAATRFLQRLNYQQDGALQLSPKATFKDLRLAHPISSPETTTCTPASGATSPSSSPSSSSDDSSCSATPESWSRTAGTNWAPSFHLTPEASRSPMRPEMHPPELHLPSSAGSAAMRLIQRHLAAASGSSVVAVADFDDALFDVLSEAEEVQQSPIVS